MVRLSRSHRRLPDVPHGDPYKRVVARFSSSGVAFVLVVLISAVLAACSSSSSTSRRAAPPASAPAATAPALPTQGSTEPPPSIAGPASRKPPHVMVIVLENREFGAVVGSREAPFLGELAAKYGLATNVFARTHPSLPNYLELLTGQTFGITSDCTSCTVEGDTLADQLQRAGVPWAAFMEGMPAPCFTGPVAGRYAKKHNPFVYVRHVVADAALCAHVQPHDGLAAALNAPTAPAFVWITPDLCNDGHDCSLATVDTWLRGELGVVQSSPWYRDGGTVVVTWDEGSSGAGCCGKNDGGHIATYVVAEGVTAGGRLTSPVSQAGILGTIEDVYGVARLGDAAAPASGSLLPLFPPQRG